MIYIMMSELWVYDYEVYEVNMDGRWMRDEYIPYHFESKGRKQLCSSIQSAQLLVGRTQLHVHPIHIC